MMDLQEIERIQFKMQRIRRHMNDDVDRLQADAAQLMDWKYYVRRHPIASMAAVAAAGYFLIPSATPPAENRVYLDPDVSREFTEKTENVSRTEVRAEQAGQGLLLSLGAMAGNALIKAGLNYLSQQLRETWLKDFQTIRNPSGPGPGSQTS